MYTTARATCWTSMRGSTSRSPFAWMTPLTMGSVISVAALPISIWPHAMSYLRPSRDVDLVKPVIACFVAVYGAEFGLGAWADMEPLLTIRPPRGSWLFMILIASWVQRNAPVRLAPMTELHTSYVRSSSGTGGAPAPAFGRPVPIPRRLWPPAALSAGRPQRLNNLLPQGQEQPPFRSHCRPP